MCITFIVDRSGYKFVESTDVVHVLDLILIYYYTFTRRLVYNVIVLPREISEGYLTSPWT